MKYSTLTNLLPLPRQRALVRSYYLRLGSLATTLLTILIIIAGILLLPTYIFLMESTGAKESQLASLATQISSEDETDISSRLQTLTERAGILTALSDTPSVSQTIRAILTVSHPQIVFSAFTYTQKTTKAPRTLVIAGIASTRDALRNYQLALQGTPSVLSATLPVSVYAKDTDISFAITVAFSP